MSVAVGGPMQDQLPTLWKGMAPSPAFITGDTNEPISHAISHYSKNIPILLFHATPMHSLDLDSANAFNCIRCRLRLHRGLTC